MAIEGKGVCMKSKSAISAIVGIALAMCLTCVFAPAAFAVDDGASQALSAGTIKAQATAKTPKLKKVTSIRLSSAAMGEIRVTCNAPKTPDSLTFKSYTVKYSYKKNMKGAKTKTVKTSSNLNMTINKVKKGQRVYVQIRANAKYGNKIVHSAWSKVKSVKVDTKHKYTYTLLKKPKYFNSWDECWAYCEKQPEVTYFNQNCERIVKKVNGVWVDDTPW